MDYSKNSNLQTSSQVAMMKGKKKKHKSKMNPAEIMALKSKK